MRPLFFLFLLFHFLSSIDAQQSSRPLSPEDAEFSNYVASHHAAIVDGQLHHFDPSKVDSVTIRYTIVAPGRKAQITKTSKLRKDGSFALELDEAYPLQQIWLSIGEIFYSGIYISTDLHIDLDMKKLNLKSEVSFNGEGVSFSGNDGPLTEYMNNFVLFERNNQLRLSDSAQTIGYVHTISDDAWRIRLEKIFEEMKLIEDRYISIHPSPFSWILENERLSDFYGHACSRYWGRKMDDGLWKKVMHHKPFLISNGGTYYYQYIATYITYLKETHPIVEWKELANALILDEGDTRFVDSLRKADNDSTSILSYYKSKDQTVKRLLRKRNVLYNALNCQLTVSYLDKNFTQEKADQIKLKIGGSGQLDLDEQRQIIEITLPSVKTDWCKKYIKNELTEVVTTSNEINKALAESVAPKPASFGTPIMQTSFGANMYKASGIGALDLIKRIHQTYPNTAIVIDRWAPGALPV